MGWLIAPEDKAVLVYRPQQETSVLDEPSTIIPVPVFAKDLAITAEDLFALLLL